MSRRVGESWRLLSERQALCLWEAQIEQSSHGTQLELLQVPQTAEKALQAHRLLNEYELNLDSMPLTPDQQIFRHWRENCLTVSREKSLLDRSELSFRIVAGLRETQLFLPKQVLLVGFDRIPPGVARVRDCFTALGSCCVAVEPSPTEEQGRAVRFAATDRHHEAESAARWARGLLEQGAGSVGIVVPDLATRRNEIERVFREQIDPCSVALSVDDETVLSLSLGSPLAEEGVIHAALEFISIENDLPLEQLSFLLRTPYLGGGEQETDARALFDRKLRSYRQLNFRLGGLEALAKKTPCLTVLAGILKSFSTRAAEHDKRRPREWGEFFSDLLVRVGWPGDRPMSSSEYQAVNAWKEKVLFSLAELDRVLPAVGRRKILALLKRMSRTTEFQLKAPTGPVQVVGLLEAGGLHFDHLWVLGLEETALPATAQPNPFIPYQMQIGYEMPHADAAREMHYATRVLKRLRAASHDVVFSYPTSEGDRNLQPSPLISEYPSEPSPCLAAFNDLARAMRADDLALDVVDDCRGPALAREFVEGGTGLLKDQAHCPFRAFLHHRLHSRAFAVAEPGFSALIRGDLLHRTLELLWRQLRSRETLAELDEQSRNELIRENVKKALDGYFEDRPLPSVQLLVLEASRIETLVGEWLETVELQRDDFRVLELEYPHVEQFGLLQLRMQVDRIDQLADGERVIIDYKTGSRLRAEDFLCAPLLEPQLPIYAVAQAGAEADAVVFAQVRKGDCRFHGVARRKNLLPRVRDLSSFRNPDLPGVSDWSELLSFWRRQISNLADDFVAGDARVQPFDPALSCRYCDLPGLCRIQEFTAVAGGSDDR